MRRRLSAFLFQLFLLAPLFAISDIAVPAESVDWATDTRWQSHVEWVLHQLETCKQAVDDQTHCNRFVGEALERVYGISDFRRSTNEFYAANDIVQIVEVPKNKWQLIGRASDQSVLDRAQRDANAGFAVLAVRPDVTHGHVALIIPGQLTASKAWDG